MIAPFTNDKFDGQDGHAIVNVWVKSGWEEFAYWLVSADAKNVVHTEDPHGFVRQLIETNADELIISSFFGGTAKSAALSIEGIGEVYERITGECN